MTRARSSASLSTYPPADEKLVTCAGMGAGTPDDIVRRLSSPANLPGDLRWPLRIAEDRRDGVLVLTLTGRLGVESAGRLEAAAHDAIQRQDARLVIDLVGVDYLSSAGLKALAEAGRRCRDAGGALVLCGVVDAVRMAVDLGGLAARVPIETSRDLAIVRAARTPDAGACG